ncbi:MAG: FhaA domain-containing protein [Acidimicrobiales bacterium]
MGLQQFERRLEHLVEGAFAKAFRSGLQPVELGRRITREMDANRTVGVRGLIVPNRFRIAISPADDDRFASFAEALTRELAEAAREHAHAEGYTFMGPVEVELHRDDSLGAGEFLLAGEVAGRSGGGPVGSLALDDGSLVRLGDQPVVIGRLPECDLALADPNVSRRHAELRPVEGGWVVVDLGSTNGTRVNGAGVTERPLQDGDEITVGSSRLRFQAS